LNQLGIDDVKLDGRNRDPVDGFDQKSGVKFSILGEGGAHKKKNKTRKEIDFFFIFVND
jgi:hypothetical protein